MMRELWGAIQHQPDYEILRIISKGDKKRFRKAFSAFRADLP